MGQSMKVGALAKRTGLTVRTLHHYDEIGLLSPTDRTASGHRLYREDDVARLQQIVSLKHLGLPLEEIRACLALPHYTLERTLDLHIQRIEERIAEQARIRDLLRHLRDRLRAADGVGVEELTRTIEATMTYERYYTPEQLDRLRRRAEEVGEERIGAVQQEWTDLFAAYTQAMGDGIDPGADEVKELARRSAALIEEFTGGDVAIRRSLDELYRGEGAERTLSSHGIETVPGLWEYMARARAALERDEGRE